MGTRIFPQSGPEVLARARLEKMRANRRNPAHAGNPRPLPRVARRYNRSALSDSAAIRLECAAFLDGAAARDLPYPRDTVRGCIERFLACAYRDLGKAPHLLEGDELEELLGQRLPAHFGVRDPLAEAVEDVLTAYLADLGERAVVLRAYELRRALLEHAGAFRRRVAAGDLAGRAAGPAARPFVHRVDKTGRNDPCPCGSGKKFKQCCQRLGG